MLKFIFTLCGLFYSLFMLMNDIIYFKAQISVGNEQKFVNTSPSQLIKFVIFQNSVRVCQIFANCKNTIFFYVLFALNSLL